MYIHEYYHLMRQVFCLLKIRSIEKHINLTNVFFLPRSEDNMLIKNSVSASWPNREVKIQFQRKN